MPKGVSLLRLFIYIIGHSIFIYIYIYIYIYIERERERERESVMVIVLGNGHEDTSSNPGRDCISHSTNTLGKGMYPITLPPSMDK